MKLQIITKFKVNLHFPCQHAVSMQVHFYPLKGLKTMTFKNYCIAREKIETFTIGSSMES